MKTIIGIIGAANASEEEKKISEEVGVLIARRKCFLLCGGMGGVMEAACRGAKSAGGTTIGILPGTKPSCVNSFVDIPIVTGMGGSKECDSGKIKSFNNRGRRQLWHPVRNIVRT